MSILDLQTFRETALINDPFEHFVVEQCLNKAHLARLREDFPKITRGGSFPPTALQFGPTFEDLLNELRGEEVRQIFEQKFQIDLTNRPTTLTVRGQTRKKDGRIHTDSKSKLITVLLYLNPAWNAQGGRLRLLRSPDNIEDVISEIVPCEGTLVAFRCRDNAWHGHKQFAGERRSLQLNWVTNDAAAKGSGRRHQLSAFLKSMNPMKRVAS